MDSLEGIVLGNASNYLLRKIRASDLAREDLLL